MPKAPGHRKRPCQSSCRTPIWHFTGESPTATKLKFTEQSENVYENKGRGQEVEESRS